MMCSVTKATPLHFINGKCHIKQIKTRKSHITCLTNHIWFIQHHITSLISNALGADTQTYLCRNKSNFKKPGAHWPSAGVCLA